MIRRLLICIAATAGLVACDSGVDDPKEGGKKGAAEGGQKAGAEAPKGIAKKDPNALPESTKLLPIPDQGPMGELEEEGEEVEVYSAVITAVDCAKRLAETEDKVELEKCGPLEAAMSGFAIYDPAESEIYLLDPAGFYQYELEAGFQGSMDISGTLVGSRHGLPVLKPEDYTITNKPAAGAFKGCL